ncbi:MAG TPA: hypothetical protein VKQ09_05125 [Sphingomonas sp.]|jgi:hypothetical protein|nr:hypothetical protein [Sphingomonas sp.]
MFSFDLSNVRQALVSAAGALFFCTVLVGAAVLPAQVATAAVLGL